MLASRLKNDDQAAAKANPVEIGPEMTAAAVSCTDSSESSSSRSSAESQDDIGKLLARLNTISCPERSKSSHNLRAFRSDSRPALFELAAENEDPVAYAPLKDAPTRGVLDVGFAPIPFVAPLAVMRARVAYRETAALAADGFFVKGAAYAPRLPAGTAFYAFEDRHGDVERNAVPPAGSHAFLRIKGEPWLRVAMPAREFGSAAGDAGGLARTRRAGTEILLAGELETDGAGRLLRWMSRGGALRYARCPDALLPRRYKWELVDEIVASPPVSPEMRPRKIAKLAMGGFAVKEHPDPSPACVTRAPIYDMI